MASEGPNNGATWNSQAFPVFPWEDPINAQFSDDIYTFCELGSLDDNSDLLTGSNFGFAIPGGSTIDGFLLEVERKCQVSAIQDIGVQLFIGATLSANRSAGAIWPLVDTFQSFGGAADTWGFAAALLTPANINDELFGCALACANVTGVGDFAFIDNARITVFFTEASGSVGWQAMGMGRPQ